MKILDGASNSDSDKRIFFKAQVIFYLLMATDGHSKKFSIYHHSSGRCALTPLYGILSNSTLFLAQRITRLPLHSKKNDRNQVVVDDS